MRRLNERGEGRIGCILWVLVLAAGILVASKAIPVKLTDVEFGDFIEEQAQFAGRASGDTIRKRILKKAKELDLPLDPKSLRIDKTNQRVKISCSYPITLDFSVYEYTWVLKHSIDRPVFIV